MSAPTVLNELAQFASDTTFDSLPREVVVGVQERVLDTIGVALAASVQNTADGVADVIAASGGSPQATLIGRPNRVPAPAAAMHNGTLAHSLDFDDTHLPSVLHPSASVVPAALAVAEAMSAHSLAFLAAIAIGIEITIRTGMGGYLADAGNVFFERGWHATSVCGTLGAAAAAAKLLGLNAAGIGHAIGIATSFGSGVIEANRMGGTVKRLHCGWAAHSGILAAQLAEAGYTAPPTAFEGRFGFYRAFIGGRFDREAVVAGLGGRWDANDVHFKPYPANHYTHAGIDAALAIRAERPAFDAEDITAIQLGSAAAALRTIGEPREAKVRPESGYHARFSGPFTVATALLGGSGLGVHFDDFTDARVRDPRYLRLAAKVSTFVDPECDAAFPRAFASVLRVHFRDGSVAEKRVMDNRGGPKWPLTPAELRLKFALNARGAMRADAAERLADTVFSLDRKASVEHVAAQLHGERVSATLPGS